MTIYPTSEIEIYLTPEVEQALIELVEEAGNSLEFYINEALTMSLVDIVEEQIEEKRLKDIAEGNDDITTSDDFWSKIPKVW